MANWMNMDDWNKNKTNKIQNSNKRAANIKVSVAKYMLES